MEDSHMHLRGVFQFTPPRCNIWHLYLPMIFFFFLLEHSSHKRTVILPYVSPFPWYIQAAGTRYTSLQLSLSAQFSQQLCNKVHSYTSISSHFYFPIMDIFRANVRFLQLTSDLSYGYSEQFWVPWQHAISNILCASPQGLGSLAQFVCKYHGNFGKLIPVGKPSTSSEV